jgi:hypothetical protein
VTLRLFTPSHPRCRAGARARAPRGHRAAVRGPWPACCLGAGACDGVAAGGKARRGIGRMRPFARHVSMSGCARTASHNFAPDRVIQACDCEKATMKPLCTSCMWVMARQRSAPAATPGGPVEPSRRCGPCVCACACAWPMSADGGSPAAAAGPANGAAGRRGEGSSCVGVGPAWHARVPSSESRRCAGGSKRVAHTHGARSRVRDVRHAHGRAHTHGRRTRRCELQRGVRCAGADAVERALRSG